MRNPAPVTFRPSYRPLRLSVQALKGLELVHLVSGLHEEVTPDPQGSCGRSTTVTGYTEWVDAKGSPATLGWDWEIQCMDGRVYWQRRGLPFTNLLVVGDDRQDFSWRRSLEFLAARIDTLAWPESTNAALRHRYASPAHEL